MRDNSFYGRRDMAPLVRYWTEVEKGPFRQSGEEENFDDDHKSTATSIATKLAWTRAALLVTHENTSQDGTLINLQCPLSIFRGMVKISELARSAGSDDHILGQLTNVQSLNIPWRVQMRNPSTITFQHLTSMTSLNMSFSMMHRSQTMPFGI